MYSSTLSSAGISSSALSYTQRVTLYVDTIGRLIPTIFCSISWFYYCRSERKILFLHITHQYSSSTFRKWMNIFVCKQSLCVFVLFGSLTVFFSVITAVSKQSLCCPLVEWHKLILFHAFLTASKWIDIDAFTRCIYIPNCLFRLQVVPFPCFRNKILVFKLICKKNQIKKEVKISFTTLAKIRHGLLTLHMYMYLSLFCFCRKGISNCVRE